MAGHSKWANIKHRKAAQDAKKGQAFAKFSREIIKAAKIGGGDPAGNFRLRTAIDKAKAAGLPNDNIQRAIDKGCGNSEADNVEEIAYEGYGPGGAAIYIETVTDNRNRTAGDIRSYFNKFNGNLGADGCVAWIFNPIGLITISTSNITEEDAFEKAIEAGAQDFLKNEEENCFEITTEIDSLNDVCTHLTSSGVEIQSAELTRIPENTVEITDPEYAKYLLRLMDAIEEHDDVQSVYTNFEMDDSLIESVSQ